MIRKEDFYEEDDYETTEDFLSSEQQKPSRRYIMREKTYDRISFLQRMVTACILLWIFLAGFGFGLVPSASMEPTVMTGSVFLFHTVPPETLDYGDKVVFFPYMKEPVALNNAWEMHQYRKEQNGVMFLKRLVGKPGDILTIQNGVLYRNGAPVSEPYLKESMLPDSNTYRVPPGCYFVMGDNRNISSDSRYFGAFPQHCFYGKVLFSANPFPLPEPLLERFRSLAESHPGLFQPNHMPETV